MSALTLALPPIDATAGPAATSAADLARRGQIHQTAQKFEASFLTTVLQTMFQSLPSAPPFGGGPGEDMWKGFLAEAMAKDMAKRGGIGVSAAVEREMLKLQGLHDGAGGAAAAADGSRPPSPAVTSAAVRVAAPQVTASRGAVA